LATLLSGRVVVSVAGNENVVTPWATEALRTNNNEIAMALSDLIVSP
jgi:hypothetical protein